MTNESNMQREQVLDRLADKAEEHLHVDVAGRRAAAHSLLQEMHQILLEAQQFEPMAYSSRIEPDGSLLVGDVVTVRVTRRGTIKVFPVDIMGEKLPDPDLRYGARRKAWEHGSRPVTASPVEAVLDVVLPVILTMAAARRRHPTSAPPPSSGAERTKQFRRTSPTAAPANSESPPRRG